MRLFNIEYPNSYFIVGLLGAGIARSVVATRYELNDLGVGVRVLTGSKMFFFHVVQTGSKAHPAPYPMGIWGSLHGGKEAGA
jgi:hypothetical protein